MNVVPEIAYAVSGLFYALIPVIIQKRGTVMKQIQIADTTISAVFSTLSFKEKLDIARKLERLCVDIIELPELSGAKADALLVRTIASFTKNSIISVGATTSVKSVELAADALSTASHPRIRIELPMSAAIMEYSLHKKQDKMCDYISAMVSAAKSKCSDVEFCAVDATRAEEEFLICAIKTAVDSGATTVTICDNACVYMPDDFARFVAKVTEGVDVPVGVLINNKNSLATAAAALCVKNGSADMVKTAVRAAGTAPSEATPLRAFVNMIESVRENYGIRTNIRATEIHRACDQIRWVLGGKSSTMPISVAEIADNGIKLTVNDTRDTVAESVTALGYDLSDEDITKVYEEFRRIARKKEVGAKELDAIVATSALQVPATYTLQSYVINSGNIITASAQITLQKDGKAINGIATGDGPIDAAFHALEEIIGRHFELDDFAIQTVTGEKDAMGNALVRLRVGGKIFSGTGLSTDIISASIRAYINAVNKIVYEEG